MITEILIAVIIFAVARIFLQNRNENGKYPPGPLAVPVLGHLPLLGHNPPMKLLEWSKTYGPILYVRLGSVPTVVLNDAKLIKEAFVKEEFSGRPLLKLYVETADRKGIILGDGSHTQEQRRFALTNLKDFGFGSGSMEYRIHEEITKFLKTVESQTGRPREMNNFFRTPVINAFWDLIMGYRFEGNDPALRKFTDVVDGLSDISTVGAQLSVFIPWIATWFGFLGHNKNVSAFRSVHSYMAERINEYKKTHVLGTQKDFTGVYLNKVNETKDPLSSFHDSAGHHAVATGDLFLAALDTTTKALDWLMIHMARNPEIQKKVQAEIDEIVGDSRIPSLSDRNKMPFVEAVIYELLRISPTVPLGVQHRTLQDVEFHGYPIPKNTMIISNIYGVHHDPEIWDAPETFMPERFLDNNGRFKKTPEHIPFSFGKRNCIGEAHAKDNLFLIASSFLQKFSVSCTEKVPTLDIKLEIVLTPHPFELIINQRSKNN